MILLIDNYDSFVFNLARYLEELDEEVVVLRNDATDPAGIRAMGPSHVVISPGPCTPAEAGISVEAISLLAGEVPLLGVCLGHQCLGAAFGARVRRAPRPMHGKLSEVEHGGVGLFCGLPRPLRVTRYHSLVVEEASVRPPLRVTGRASTGEVMALEAEGLGAWGVQFHPEAILTEDGHTLLANFLALGRGESVPGATPALPAELAGCPAERSATDR